jgi:AcrR family transcriptional regulator
MKSVKPTPYHHGDLKASLLTIAREQLEASGVQHLSLRKLAEQAGVSRTAPYHHFKDKNALLSALAEQGFQEWQETAKAIFDDESDDAVGKFQRFVVEYVSHAVNNPQVYDLMFGNVLWKHDKASDSLKSVAYPTFEVQVSMTKQWQALGVLSKNNDPLRLAQVVWATLHGIARLMIDGIYTDDQHIEDMCQCATDLLIAKHA